MENGGYRYEVGPSIDMFSRSEVSSIWPERFHRDAPYRIWLLENQEALDVGSYNDYVFEAQSTSSLQNVANYTIEFAPSWQRLVIHELSVLRKGKWLDRNSDASITLSRRETSFESSVYDGQVSALIVFKDVAINEPMRVRYSILGAHPLLKGVNGARYTLSWDVPVLERRIQVKAAKGQTLVHQIVGRESEFKLPPGALKASTTELSLFLREAPTVRWVDLLPRDQSAFPTLTVAPKQTWANVQSRAEIWFANAFAPPSKEVTELANKLSEKVDPKTDPHGYSLLALRYVQDQVRYFAILIDQSTHKPHSPTEVLERGYGDCKDKSQLLTSLLRAKGIDATPALVSVSRQKILLTDLPDVGSFDHAIVLVQLGAKVYWLDPTRTDQGGTLDKQGFPDYGYALPVTSAKPIRTLIAMERPKLDGVTSQTLETFTVKSGAELETELQIDSTYAGDSAESMRARFATQGKRRVRMDYKDYYERVYGTLSKQSLVYKDDRANNRLNVSERYRLAKLWKQSNGERYADFSAQSASYSLKLPDVVEREVGLRIYHPMSIVERTEFKLPTDADFLSVPADLSIKDAAFLYARKVTQKDGMLQIEHTLETLSDSVAPKDLALHIERRRAALDALSVRVFWKLDDAKSADTEDQIEDRQARYRQLLEKLRKQQP